MPGKIIDLEDDGLLTVGTDKSSALAWHYDSQDLILGTSCSSEFSEVVLAEYRNLDKNEEVTVTGLSRDASSSGVLMESVRMESRPCSKSVTARSKKE